MSPVCSRLPWAHAVVSVVAAAVVASGCASQPADDHASAAELVHIHRLQQAPDGEGVYAATHTGLYRIDADVVRRVGDAAHDLMGFTVAGPGDLLASGHPDLRDQSLLVEGKPPLLGLAASRDGEQWEALSLLGDVDFHSLVAAHGNVYGLDAGSGDLMVSADRRAWETRAAGLLFTDLAVDPSNADVLVGASPEGVHTSRDGGQTWQPTSDQRLLYLSWTSAGLFGLSPEAAIAVSRDGGGAWDDLAVLGGRPAALLATDAGRIFAATDRGVFVSEDAGRTFSDLVAVEGG